MKLAEYYTIREGVQANAPRPDLEAVAAMKDELQAALLASDLFHTVEVDHTDDADRLVIAMCSFAPGVGAANAAAELARLWRERIGYDFWKTQTTMMESGHAELQGVTRVSPRGHFLTVHVVAQAAAVPALAAVPAQPTPPPRPTFEIVPAPQRVPARRPQRVLVRLFARPSALAA